MIYNGFAQIVPYLPLCVCLCVCVCMCLKKNEVKEFWRKLTNQIKEISKAHLGVAALRFSFGSFRFVIGDFIRARQATTQQHTD